jgi:hypothetical protein
MAGISRVGGRDSETKERVVSGETLAIGDLVMASRSAGTVTAATSSATVSLMQGGGITVNAVVSTDTKALIFDIVPGATYIVTSTNNSNIAHNNMRMVVGANAHTINNTGTDDATNGIFMQTGVIGATTDKKIKGEFIVALT